MSERPIIYIPDPSYGNPDYYPGLDEIGSSKRFSSETAEKFSLPAREANIGAGADWPAVALEVIEFISDKELLMVSIALFFSGKKINENIEAWLLIGEKLKNAVNGCLAIPNRCAALLLGLQKHKEDNNIKVNNIKLFQYQALDGRAVSDLNAISIPKVNVIKDETPQENLGHVIHFFRLSVNGEEIEVLVNSDIVFVRKGKGET